LKINLAPSRPVCFSAIELQPERKQPLFGFVAKSALAGLLAVLLLVSSTLALGSAHRQSHNTDQPAKGHQCVLCLFTHGQIAASDVAPPSSCLAEVSFEIASLDKHILPATIDYLLSPSRAPPHRLPCLI